MNYRSCYPHRLQVPKSSSMCLLWYYIFWRSSPLLQDLFSKILPFSIIHSNVSKLKAYLNQSQELCKKCLSYRYLRFIKLSWHHCSRHPRSTPKTESKDNDNNINSTFPFPPPPRLNYWMSLISVSMKQNAWRNKRSTPKQSMAGCLNIHLVLVTGLIQVGDKLEPRPHTRVERLLWWVQ